MKNRSFFSNTAFAMEIRSFGTCNLFMTLFHSEASIGIEDGGKGIDKKSEITAEE